jgi:hypothetical protein
VTIPARGRIEKTFTVTVKNPIPATPVSASNPLSYDYVLHNKYGRDVNIQLTKPASKVVEQTTFILPSSGPFTSILMALGALLVVGYFFFRSRLLIQELEIIHKEFSSGVM